MSKPVKIVLIVVIILAVIGTAYYFLGGSATDNKYASAAAVRAGKSGSDGAWSDTDKPGFSQLFNIGIPKSQTYSAGIFYEDAFGQAWFKGMNIKLTVDNVNKYAKDVVTYVGSSFKLPHWQVTTGSFLNA